jgi:hypothetical protein
LSVRLAFKISCRARSCFSDNWVFSVSKVFIWLLNETSWLSRLWLTRVNWLICSSSRVLSFSIADILCFASATSLWKNSVASRTMRSLSVISCRDSRKCWCWSLAVSVLARVTAWFAFLSPIRES